MTQTLWITQGPYFDRWITMKDADADDARTHHFGFKKIPDWTVPDSMSAPARQSFVAADVPFLAAWVTRLQAASYTPKETAAPNVAPTALVLSPSTVSRVLPVGTVVGLLSATDADQTGGHTFTSADVNFRIAGINGNQVEMAVTPGPTAGPYVMTVTAVDSAGGSFTGTVTITVTA